MNLLRKLLISSHRIFPAFILILICGFIFLPGIAKATTETFPTFGPGGSGTWTAPVGVYSVIVEVWAGGGQGGGSSNLGGGAGGGGAGGGFASKTVTVVPCHSYSYYVGKPGYFGTATTDGSAGQDSWFIDAATVLAKGGGGGLVGPDGAGGIAPTTGAIGTTIYNGGDGAAGVRYSYSGGGGGGAGSAGNGTAAVGATKGTGGIPDGGDGGQAPGVAGSSPGGGGAGSSYSFSQGWWGGFGGRGQIRLTYTAVTTTKTITTFGAGAWTAPTGVTCVLAETWAGGGAGGTAGMGGEGGGGGGAGGGFAAETVTVVPGNFYDYYVGKGGWWAVTAGEDSWFKDGVTTVVLSKGGGAGGNGSSGAGGIAPTTGAIGTTIYNGGDGAAGVNASYSGGGGGGAGSAGNGGEAATITAGSGGSSDGGAGGAGKTTTGSGDTGSAPGGGGGGGKEVDNEALWAAPGGSGGRGQIRLTYALPTSWAWNANVGWISFDSTNCDSDGNGFIDRDDMVPGCGGDNSTMIVFNYGISVDPATGNFSGYAWSNSVGWVDFGPAVDLITYPGCGYPEAPCNSAKYSSGAVTGWAKILSMGDNGWIKLSGSWAGGVTINPSTGDFSGWAWNANDNGSGIGWISFNCDHTNDGTLPPDNVNTCGTSNYKVIININSINSPPTAVDLTAPNWGYAEAGQYGALNAKLGWTFSDSDADPSESAYQIIVNTQNSTTTPTFDSGKCLGTAPPDDPDKCPVNIGAPFTLRSVHQSNPGPTNILEYDTSYYWWVKVWDDNGIESDWVQYDTNPDVPPEANDGSNNKTFTTYKHEMPRADFSWFPQKPNMGEEVKLVSQSKRFNDSNQFGEGVDCTDDDDPAGTICTYEWTLPDSAHFKSTDPNDQTASTTLILFDSVGGNQEVKLKVTDSEGYEGILSQQIIVNAKLPGWKEVKPE